jgi:SWI/SNF-related matrix-associated actin-dependent regulator of chromatin subfamily A protein 2/4
LNDEGSQSDVRVTVTSNGKILSGEDAPLASQLQTWLEMNPGWEPVPREEEEGDDEGSDDEDSAEEDNSEWINYLTHIELNIN